VPRNALEFELEVALETELEVALETELEVAPVIIEPVNIVLEVGLGEDEELIAVALEG